jgi:hypothetical protein
MESYNDLVQTFEELCEQFNVSPPVGTSQELTKNERVQNVSGMLSTAEDKFPDEDEATEFVRDCEEFLDAQ